MRHFGAEEDDYMRQGRERAEKGQREYDRLTLDDTIALDADSVETYTRLIASGHKQFETDLKDARERYEANVAWRARQRELRGGGDAPHLVPKGDWRFVQLFDTNGDLIGWDALYEGAKAGTLILRDDDIWVLSQAMDEATLRRAGLHMDRDEFQPADIMAAFVKLYPRGGPERRQRALPGPRRELTAGEPFGPSRDWSEDD